MVMGGSWGVTLALAYSQTYPSTVSALILRGVCMLRQAEIDWFYKQGANSLFPFAWERLISVLDPSEHDMVLTAFHHRLTSNDAQRQFQAARAWLNWELGLSFFSVSSLVYSWDGRQYLTEPPQEGNRQGQKTASNKKSEESAHVERKASGDSSRLSSSSQIALSETASFDSINMPSQVVQARLECHYFINKGFLRENQLIHDIARIRHIPCVIIHGRYDFVCPLKNAFDLHRAWPEAQLYIVSNAGHSMYEKGISHQLVCATDQYKSLKY